MAWKLTISTARVESQGNSPQVEWRWWTARRLCMTSLTHDKPSFGERTVNLATSCPNSATQHMVLPRLILHSCIFQPRALRETYMHINLLTALQHRSMIATSPQNLYPSCHCSTIHTHLWSWWRNLFTWQYECILRVQACFPQATGQTVRVHHSTDSWRSFRSDWEIKGSHSHHLIFTT